MASPDDDNQNAQGPQGDPGIAQTTDSEKGNGALGGVSDLFGLKGQAGDTAKPTGQTGGTTSTGLPPTSLYVPLPDDATPRTLQGRYRLVAQLGMGGMGVTYRAWDAKEGIPVVIKMPRKDVRNNPEIMDRFNREVRTMLELSHEHIVPITDHGEEEGCPFVAMRFLPGGSLSEYRGRDDAGKAATLSPATLHFWLPGIARALDFMHSSGVLHRDVKPGNIFLDGFLKPFLGDFGIAKVVDDSAGLNREYTLTATRMAVGTPEYMAPELFRPRATPDGRVDQYALAVTVYEMLAGRKPFRGDGAHIIVEHASKDVPPLQEFCPDVPKKLAEAVHKALSKNPEDRFATCSEFAEALIAQAPPLKIDTSRARLLCPSCRAILRVPATSAGKGGTCPKCKSPVAVAQDLSSLWLGGEDRSTVGVAAGVVSDTELVAEEHVPTPEQPYVELPEQGGIWRQFIPDWRGTLLALLIGSCAAVLWMLMPQVDRSPWTARTFQILPYLAMCAAAFVARRKAEQAIAIDSRIMWVGVALLLANSCVVPLFAESLNATPLNVDLLRLISALLHFNGLACLLFVGPPMRRGFSFPDTPAISAVQEIFSLAMNEEARTITVLPGRDVLQVTISGNASGKPPICLRLKKELAAGMSKHIRTLIHARHGMVLSQGDRCVHAGRHTSVTDQGESLVVHLFDPRPESLTKRALHDSKADTGQMHGLDDENRAGVSRTGANGGSVRPRLTPDLEKRFEGFLAQDEPSTQKDSIRPLLTAGQPNVARSNRDVDQPASREGVNTLRFEKADEEAARVFFRHWCWFAAIAFPIGFTVTYAMCFWLVIRRLDFFVAVLLLQLLAAVRTFLVVRARVERCQLLAATEDELSLQIDRGVISQSFTIAVSNVIGVKIAGEGHTQNGTSHISLLTMRLAHPLQVRGGPDERRLLVSGRGIAATVCSNEDVPTLRKRLTDIGLTVVP